MIYLVDFIYSFSLSLCIYIHFVLDISQQRSIRASVLVSVYSVTLYMYTEKKPNYLKEKKKFCIRMLLWFCIILLCCLFFSVLCQWLMISYKKQEFVFLFVGKEKNKIFFFLS